jgi:hypothetical protein
MCRPASIAQSVTKYLPCRLYIGGCNHKAHWITHQVFEFAGYLVPSTFVTAGLSS